jgi:hypothetical protein
MKKLLLVTLFLAGCSNSTIPNSNLYQEDYDGNCFRPQITWSDMSLCLKHDRDKEWEQNHLTNTINKSS